MDAMPVGRADRQKEVPDVMKFPGCETCWGQIMDKQSILLVGAELEQYRERINAEC